MGDFKTKLIDEKNQLSIKLDALDNFILSESFNEIDDIQKSLLQVQVTAMNTYLQCLKERIAKL